MERREFLKAASLTAAGAMLPANSGWGESSQAAPVTKPNIIFCVSDQHRAGLTKRSGYPLDTSPTLDKLADAGIGFDRAYCTTPLCVPSRTSMLTGLQKGLARHPVPIMLLARLAVHQEWQRKGVGRGLLRDSILRTLQAADIAGIRALAVHAKDDHAKKYYEQFDFVSSPTDPLHLFVLLKDLRKLVLSASNTRSPK